MTHFVWVKMSDIKTDDFVYNTKMNGTESTVTYFSTTKNFICTSPNCKEIPLSCAHYHCSVCPFVFSTKERAQDYRYHSHPIAATAAHVKGQ